MQHVPHGYATVTATAAASSAVGIQPPAGICMNQSCDEESVDVGEDAASVRYSWFSYVTTPEVTTIAEEPAENMPAAQMVQTEAPAAE